MSERKKVSARRFLEESCFWNSPVAKPSDYLYHLDDLLGDEPLKVILLGRVSYRTQKHKGNLDNSLTWMRNYLSDYNVVIVKEDKMVQSGMDDDRLKLEVVAEMAREVGAVILTESPDRYIRSIDFNTKTNPDALPTVGEYEKLIALVGDVKLATILHPDTPWKEIRSHQTKRGQEAKGKSGGHPVKAKYTTYTQEEKNRVRALRRKGLSYGKIKEIMDDNSDGKVFPKSTIIAWIK